MSCVVDRGLEYILDYFTKWKEAYAMPNMEAITIATCSSTYKRTHPSVSDAMLDRFPRWKNQKKNVWQLITANCTFRGRMEHCSFFLKAKGAVTYMIIPRDLRCIPSSSRVYLA